MSTVPQHSRRRASVKAEISSSGCESAESRSACQRRQHDVAGVANEAGRFHLTCRGAQCPHRHSDGRHTEESHYRPQIDWREDRLGDTRRGGSSLGHCTSHRPRAERATPIRSEPPSIYQATRGRAHRLGCDTAIRGETSHAAEVARPKEAHDEWAIREMTRQFVLAGFPFDSALCRSLRILQGLMDAGMPHPARPFRRRRGYERAS